MKRGKSRSQDLSTIRQSSDYWNPRVEFDEAPQRITNALSTQPLALSWGWQRNTGHKHLKSRGVGC